MKIDELGKKLVNCSLKCEGIINDKKKGILPRCLYFDKERKGKKGAIVVGINPAKAKNKKKMEEEREYYLKTGLNYESEKNYFKKNKFPYYKKTKELLEKLNFNGSILWTELVKCECDKKRVLPMQTVRTCVNKYLEKEIKLYLHYPVFCLGNDVFNCCALSFPDRFVIGIPHPTGSHGHFTKLMKRIKRKGSINKYKKILMKQKDKKGKFLAIKLNEVKPR